MLDAPALIQTTLQRTAVIHLVIPKADMRAAIGPGIRELMSAIAAQGVRPIGPWFNHHLKIVPDIWDFEISVPVASPVVPMGRVAPSQWPSMKMARAVYHGPYEGLGNAWGEFMSWIAANGHAVSEGLWERYLAGPDSSPDPANWRTELSKQLVE